MEDYCHYPGIDAPDEQKREFVRKLVNPLNRYRTAQMHRMAFNLWMYRGVQWIRRPKTLKSGSDGGYRFELDSRDGFRFDLPVDNYIATNVDNEVSRFQRKQYKPDVQAEKNLPELLAAARLGRSILMHEHQAKHWRDVEHEMAFDFALAGTGIIKTYLDVTHTSQRPIASTEAMACPQCQAKFASPNVSSSFHSMGLLPGSPETGPRQFLGLDSVTVEGDTARMKVCPLCGEGELAGYQPSVQEAMEAKDFLGRGLGEMVPEEGEPVLEGVPWSEFYFENGGIGVEPHTMKCCGQRTPRSVDWVKARFPEFRNVQAEQPSDLMKAHPTLGMQIVWGGGVASAHDEGIYDDHVNFIEVHIDPMPYPGLEDGHSMYMVGDEIISKPLTVDVETPEYNGASTEPRKVKKVQYHVARRKRIPREGWGRTPVDDQCPLQKRLNRLDAQVEDLRERGIPWMAIPTGVEFHDSGDVEGSFKWYEYENQGGDQQWTPRDAIVNGEPKTGNAYLAERDKIVLSLQRLGAQDVELGKNPVGAKTIGQLQILAEEAQQQRGPAEEDLKRAYEKAFGHILELKWAFQKKAIELEVEGTETSYERQSYTGSNLLGQTRVRVDAKGAVDKTVIQAELAFRALETGLYALDTFSARDEFLEVIGAPKLDHAISSQVERANQAWFEFKSELKIPVIDEHIHNPLVWYQTLGNAWLSDEALQEQREADWDNVLRKIAGWQPEWEQAAAQDQELRSIYEGKDPSQWQAVYIQGTQAVQQAQVAYQAALATNPQATPPPMSSFPPPPTQPFLPKAIDQQILLTWQKRLGAGFPVRDTLLQIKDPQLQQSAAKRERLLRIYAVINQCRILAEQKAMQVSAMAAPKVPAPGQPGGVEAAAAA